jgi:hypothetical protein
MFKYDADTHTYYFNGEIMPSFSSLYPWYKVGYYYFNVETQLKIDADIFENAGAAGSYFHTAAINTFKGNIIDTNSQWKYEEVKNCYFEFLKVVKYWNLKPILELCEIPLICRKYRFGFQVDFFGYWNQTENPVIIDWKTGGGKELTWQNAQQLCGYEIGIKEYFPDCKKIDKVKVYLPKKKGNFYQEEVKNEALHRANFLSQIKNWHTNQKYFKKLKGE